MYKGIKKLTITFSLIVGLLLTSIPMQVSASTEEIPLPQSKTGLEPITAIELSIEDIANTPSLMDDTATVTISDADRAYWTNFGSDYYYQFLNENEKKFWNDLEEFCLTCVTSTDDYATSSYIPCESPMEMQRLKNV